MPAILRRKREAVPAAFDELPVGVEKPSGVRTTPFSQRQPCRSPEAFSGASTSAPKSSGLLENGVD